MSEPDRTPPGGPAEDRSKPPDGYRLHAPVPSAVPSGWWCSADTLADYFIGRTRDQCVAACWAHRDRIVASATAELLQDRATLLATLQLACGLPSTATLADAVAAFVKRNDDERALVAELRAELERTREQNAAYCSRVFKAFVEAAGEDWSDYQDEPWEEMVAVVGQLYEDWRELDDLIVTARTEALREALSVAVAEADRQEVLRGGCISAEQAARVAERIAKGIAELMANHRPSTPMSPTTSAEDEGNE